MNYQYSKPNVSQISANQQFAINNQNNLQMNNQNGYQNPFNQNINQNGCQIQSQNLNQYNY
jgi:hypothetical protein